MTKHRFDGACRVQLTVYDISATAFTDGRVNFAVKVLPRLAHPSTAFSAGRMAYFGPSLADAWCQVQRHARGAVLPAGLKRYVGKPAGA